MSNLQSFLEKTYSGKKVFVTGHTGFKGSWLLCWLQQLKANVKGYALAPQQRDELYNLVHGDELCKSIIGDIRDKETLQKEIKDFAPNFVFHLAAQSLVRLSYERPVETFEVNVNGTVNLLESLKSLDKKCSTVIVTTDKVYRNLETGHPFNENDSLGGHDPYSASKAAAEIVVSSYRNSFFDPANYQNHKQSIATARAGNVIGGGDLAKDRIVPDIVRAMKNNEAVKVRHPNAVRPWQHVIEPLSGYLLLAAKMNEDPKFGTAWNFGPETKDVLRVEELVKLALKCWGKGSYEKVDLKDQPHEAGHLQLDITKAKKELNWIPRLQSGKAIEMTIDWYKNAGPSYFDFSINQIKEYESLQS